jgi:hypothetical protein
VLEAPALEKLVAAGSTLKGDEESTLANGERLAERLVDLGGAAQDHSSRTALLLVRRAVAVLLVLVVVLFAGGIAVIAVSALTWMSPKTWTRNCVTARFRSVPRRDSTRDVRLWSHQRRAPTRGS